MYLVDRNIPLSCIAEVILNPEYDLQWVYFNQQNDSREELKKAQEQDPHIGPIYTAMRDSRERPSREMVEGASKETVSYWTQWDSLRMQEGLLYREFPNLKAPHIILKQILLPVKDRRKVWTALHKDKFGGGHYGIQKSYEKVKERYYWFGMSVDLDVWGKACLECQHVKNPPQHYAAHLHPIPIGFPNERIHMDIVDPRVNTKRNNRWILTMQDAYTKWLEVFPLKSMRAEEIADVMIKQYFCRFGVPLQIHTDMGANFESQLIRELGRKIGYRKTRTTYAYPQSDGLIERSHRVLNHLLKQYVNHVGRDWDEALPYIGLSYRCTVHDSTGFTPNMLTLCREANLPVHIIYGSVEEDRLSPSEYVSRHLAMMEDSFRIVRDNIKGAQRHYREMYDRRVHGPGYSVGDKVWIYLPFPKPGFPAKFHKPWEGPYVITKVVNEQTYVVESTNPLPAGHTKVVHYNKLKPFVELRDQSDHTTNSSSEYTYGRHSSSRESSTGGYNLRGHIQSTPNPTVISPPTSSTGQSSQVEVDQADIHIDLSSSGHVTTPERSEQSLGHEGSVGTLGSRNISFWPSSGTGTPFEGFSDVTDTNRGSSTESSRSSPVDSLEVTGESSASSFWPESRYMSGFEGFSSPDLNDSMEAQVGDVSEHNSDGAQVRTSGTQVRTSGAQQRTRYGRLVKPPDRFTYGYIDE